MKRTLLLLLLTLVWQHSDAQTDPLRSKLSTVFANVDKSQVPTGFLEDYGTPLVPLDIFNGMLTDSNRVNIEVWRQAYATLYTSHIYGTNPLPGLEAVNTAIGDQVNTPLQRIPILYANYNYLRPDALTANLMYVQNDQLYDVTDRSQSPYYSRVLFAATPVVSQVKTGEVSFLFEPEIFYNTTNKSVSTIQVDFGDGRGYLSASWYNAITSNYTTTGNKQVKIKVTFNDSSIAECYSSLEVLELGSIAAARYAPLAHITQFFNADANHSGGTVSVRFSTNNSTNQIQKPLIVAEGVDYSFRAPMIQQGNYSFEDFVEDINRPVYDFNFQLDDIASYDLVFLDYFDGADDITRNAALLQQVIAWVNGQKASGSPHQNVVMGISMGGLVARYALANMTKQGIPTQTRLLLTHDTPHRGANTPLGAQALTLAMNEILLIQGLNLFNIIPELEQAKATLLSPASQQMLILRATNSTGGVATNTFLDGEYRNMITFPSSGPQPSYQFKATSVGSQCGIGSMAPSTELARIDGNFFIAPRPWIRRVSYKMQVVLNALPNFGTSARVSMVRIWYNYRILSFINIDIELTNKSAHSPAGALTWDGAPGGTQSIRAQAGGSVPDFQIRFLPFLNMSMSSSFADFFCFVPTVSALDIDNITQSSLYASYAEGVTPVGTNSRAENFIAQERFRFVGNNTDHFNMVHPRFTARNAEWMFREMENPTGNNLNCTEECGGTNYAISGPSSFCTGQQTYTVNAPAGATVTWSTSSNLYPQSGSGAVANMSAVTGAGSNAWIQYNITGPCGSSTVSKGINIGPPPLTVTTYDDRYPQPSGYQYHTATAQQLPGTSANDYSWYYEDAYGNPGNYITTGLTMRQLPIPPCSNVKYQLRVTTTCGTAIYRGYAYNTSCSYTYAMYPNPADDELTVSYDPTSDEAGGTQAAGASAARAAEDFEAKLLNEKGKVLASGKSKKGSKVVLKTKGIPDGTYHLHIISGEEVTRQQVFIKH